jgi:hypothetical protein
LLTSFVSAGQRPFIGDAAVWIRRVTMCVMAYPCTNRRPDATRCKCFSDLQSYTRLYTSVWCTFHQRESELVAVGKPALSTPCHLAKVQDMTPWIVGVPATGFS